MKTKYRLKIALLMAAVLLPCASVLAQPHIGGSVYGGGNLGSVGTYTTSSDMKTFTFTANTGECTVTIDAGTIGGNVYGAGKGDDDTYWCEKAMVYKTNVTINAGTINGTVYGGGQIGRVENNTTVTIGAASPANNTLTPTIAENVFGAGAGVATHGYSALVRGDASVTVQGYAQIGLNVYGGGEKASVGRFVIKGGLPSEPADDGSGDCIVNVQGSAVIGTNTDNNITDKGNVFGTCQGITPPTSSEFTTNHTTYTSMQAVAQKAPDGTQGTDWAYVDGSDNKYYWVYYETLDAYQEFLNTLALASHPVVTIGGTLANETTGTVTPSGNPTVNGSVFGGGQRGITLGTVAVNIAGGTVNKDVYGGGALADTNKGNQTAVKYDVVTTVTVGETVVTGMYVRTGDGTDASPYTYTEITEPNTVAASGTTYYTRAAQSSINTTTVNLLGGLIHGDAYGGGLGQKNGFNGASGDIDAVVYGDINVNLGSNGGSTATAFYISTYSGDHSSVVKSGRIFGCNNLLGSPQGDVTVTAYKTVQGSTPRTPHVTDHPEKPQTGTGVTPSYELAAIYGGGNLANFTTAGKKAMVRIMKCDVSVHSVYGGGNAADVPETDVLVNGAYEIAEVFGGGNGKDQYTINGSDWVTNPGADVNGNATTLLKGGYIHEAYGGSNSKGTITGNVSINKASGGDCDLTVVELYGAGKDADIEGDLIMVMGCSTTRTEYIYGCSKNANVKGNVELTITSGEYGKIFGGNNQSGAIFGHIIVNIEETGCSPIIIDELYGCGNNAPYSVYGYFHAQKYTDSNGNLFLNAEKTIPLYSDNSNNLYKDAEHTIPLYIDTSHNDKLYIDEDKTRPLYMPRTSVNDQNTIVTFNGKPHTFPDEETGQYDDPQVNIISCTRIGKVFGGGLGSSATVYGNPIVNINQIYGTVNGTASTTLGTIGDYIANNQTIEGGVFGGGNEAAVYGNATVNIATKSTVKLHLSADDDGNYEMSDDQTVLGAKITGNVYGGGNKADVGQTHLDTDSDGNTIDVIDLASNTFVNICAVRGSEIIETVNSQEQPTGRYNYTPVSFAANAVTISGSVFGGGKGEAAGDHTTTTALAGAFRCGKAMVTGNTNVAIGNGTVSGSVYGGGMVGRVEGNTTVSIGFGTGVASGAADSAPVISQDVFGAGKGVNTHGYSALVRGETNVTIAGNAKITQSIYGGGEIASTGRYKVAQKPEEAAANGVELGMPYSLVSSYPRSGYATVTVKGYAEVGKDDMQMKKAGGPDDVGYVFGAGKGILPYEQTNGHPGRIFLDDKWEPYDGSDNEAKYLKYIETLSLTTQTYVTIDEHAFIKGSVYGGSENGHVQHDTFVYIKGYCQIGNGWDETKSNGEGNAPGGGVNHRYAETDFINPATASAEDIIAKAAILHECAHWDYGATVDENNDGQPDVDANGNVIKVFLPYDKYTSASGGATTASDGHTFFGNVFGGGSGLYPYISPYINDNNKYKWLRSAGRVYGNTNVEITGGHILTSVYGGCELTDVGNGVSVESDKGKCFVKMSGGTLGVPRTLAQIAAHPVTCYLFGAGKGDQRTHFNQWTNVGKVRVEINDSISQPIIYGSVFGGGEDGHVLGNVEIDIKKKKNTDPDPIIGTWGTSYVDGNVFGAGRGFGGDALTAGVICGNVRIWIKAGQMLGSIYGGGRLGSVGTHLVPSDHASYGQLIPDGKKQTIGNGTVTLTDDTNVTHGHVTISISGGSIGNRWEYVNVPETTTEANLATWKSNNYIPNTDMSLYKTVVETTDNTTTTSYLYRLNHTKGGNVFAGSMGRMYALDGRTPLAHWEDLGKARSTKLTISGTAIIKSNVYGGGELGKVVGYHTTKNAADANVNVGTEVIINGGTIGTEIKDGETVKYTFGSVFGGGYGSLIETLGSTYPKFTAGRVLAGTKVEMTTGTVLASVYGGGEMAAVGESVTLGEELTTGFTGDTHVIISGGTIGKDKIGTTYFGGATMGNVYGGGSGSNNTVRSGHVYGNTNVTISGADTKIYHNVYGGGAYGTVGDFTYSTSLDQQTGTNKVDGISGLNTGHTSSGVARVTITGGTIGVDGHENGMVFGSSRGDINVPGQRDDYTAWVNNTIVTIGTEGAETGPTINGSVYGSGENGHTFNDAAVIINSGTIGIAEGSAVGTLSGAAYPYRGNVYGGGCGTDKYYSGTVPTGHTPNDGEGDSFNPLAGIVYGNTTVTVNGGHIVRNVYGAGAMGSVGKVTTATGSSTTTTSNGLTTININNGIIGVSGTVGDGNVFGAARGDNEAVGNEVANHATLRLANVKTTSVTVTDGTIKGSVYGGGEVGSVGTYSTDDMRTYTFESGTGVCNVTINGGAIGTGALNQDGTFMNGNVYGASKGLANTFWCEKGMVYSTNVTINAGTINGTVYGGGQIGRVENNSTVTIGAASPANNTLTPTIAGNVFGAGAGLETHGYSALLRGNTAVTIQGNARVGLNVFGGGEIASVGKFVVAGGIPTTPDGGGDCIVNVRGGAIIGTNTDSNITNKGHVFGAGQGVTPRYYQDDIVEYNDTSLMPKRMMAVSMFNTSSDQRYWRYVSDDDHNNVWEYLYTKQKYLDFLPTLALASHPVVTIGGALNEGTITPSGTPTVNGSVYGGGQRGITLGTVAVNIVGGTMSNDVYGGGALADTNKGNWDVTNNTWAQGKTSATYTTTVNMTGGTINGTAYGGGLGDANTEAIVYGDVKVNLNGLETVDYVASTHSSLVSPIHVDNDQTTDFYLVGSNAGCVVKGYIFGCNNVNGTPKGDVKVHIFKTLKRDANGVVLAKPNKNTNTYELAAVYGGGNNAAFVPADSYNGTAYNTNGTTKTHVIIDGCDLTSIEYVYGGGNAAPASGTQVTVNSCYEIGTLFAGGNGAGEGNPGANVGYLTDGTTAYGSGVALAVLHGGTIHKAFGGSNTLGNVRTSSTVKLDETDHALCPLCVDEVYGAGNNANQDGTSNIDLGCMEFLADMYGGAKNADVNNNIVLNIQSGRFNRVFGGNNLGGCVRGSITVNIEETGCHPIVIGQLYGGGNQAGYSVRGYKFDSTQNKWVPREATDDLENGMTAAFADPKVNVKSFTSIGEIYGGGYGESAVIVGNTNVIINECVGSHATDDITDQQHDQNGDPVLDGNSPVMVSANTSKWIHFVAGESENPTTHVMEPVVETVWQPEHKSGTIGTIGNVFGGGNAAPVHGNTNVQIGQLDYVPIVSVDKDVRGYYTRSGSTYTEATGTVLAAEGITYYQRVTNGDNVSYVEVQNITVGSTPVTDYYINTGGEGDDAVYTPVPIPADANTTYYKPVIGVTITGNVYGGGNAALVTGDTNVLIGTENPTTTNNSQGSEPEPNP